jgi:hypothetical protein
MTLNVENTNQWLTAHGWKDRSNGIWTLDDSERLWVHVLKTKVHVGITDAHLTVNCYRSRTVKTLHYLKRNDPDMIGRAFLEDMECRDFMGVQ